MIIYLWSRLQFNVPQSHLFLIVNLNIIFLVSFKRSKFCTNVSLFQWNENTFYFSHLLLFGKMKNESKIKSRKRFFFTVPSHPPFLCGATIIFTITTVLTITSHAFLVITTIVNISNAITKFTTQL